MDAEKIQEFFIHHVEKMILVVVLAVAGFLMYSGLNQENILESHQPERLIADAKQVRTEVDVDHTEEILKDRIDDFDIKKEIDRVQSKVKPTDYKFAELEPKDITNSVRRRDPVMHAPKAVQMHGVLASMAMRSRDGDYPLKELEPAEALEKVVVEEKRPPASSRRRGRGSMGGDGMEEMMDMFSMEDGMDMEMDMEMDMGTEMGGTASSGASRRLSDALGMRPSPTRHFLNDTEQPPVPGTGYFIAGTAVVPYKSLYESYRSAFADAEGYDPGRRDRPIFKGYEVQRADVTGRSIDELQESDWVKRDGRTELIKDAISSWSGFAPEIVPPDYREDETLTMWIPPVMLEDYSTFALHPLIPMISKRDLKAQEAEANKENLPDEINLDEVIIGEGGVRNQSASYGMEGMGEMDDMEMGGMDMYGGGSMAAEVDPVEYKLIRFYDFAADRRDANAPVPNRKYVYRVRVILEDPNFPKDPAMQPKGNTLGQDAYVRVLEKVASVEKAAKPVEQRAIESQLASEWSEPSAPVSLPGLNKFYVGPVVERKLQAFKIGNRTVMDDLDPPKSNIIVSQYKPAFSTRLGMWLESVTEGSVLSKKAEFADIVDPITLEVKKLPEENAEVVTGATIIDIEGGIPLGIQEEDGLDEPGLILMVDEHGDLIVKEEVDDLERYRAESFAEDRGL